jgi:hypothetical protein
MTDEVAAILAERQKTHGDYRVHAAITQQIKQVIANANNESLTDSQREALDMIAHKIGRILAGNPHFKDHWVDCCGYAMLVVRELEQRHG